MRIVIQNKLSRSGVDEGSAFTLTAKFYDDASDPWTLTAPTTIRYRIDNLSSGANILDWTTVSAASSASIVVTGAQNATQDQGLVSELHEMTVQADAGLSTQSAPSFRWKVVNLRGVTA